jgi:hypothetical protein
LVLVKVEFVLDQRAAGARLANVRGEQTWMDPNCLPTVVAGRPADKMHSLRKDAWFWAI